MEMKEYEFEVQTASGEDIVKIFASSKADAVRKLRAEFPLLTYYRLI
jgi:hypothetical protein